MPRLIVFCALVLSAGLAGAETIPRSSPNDPRVRIATYQAAQVYRLNLSLTRVTTVEFDDGETIRAIIAGDTEGFEIDGVPGGRAFAIKPLASAVQTNVTVYTNRRSYYFAVEEVAHPTFYVVQFRYPETGARNRDVSAQRAQNHNYAASARRAFTPGQVWDDGTFTYFSFPRNAPVPAIFRFAQGRERTVNSGTAGNGVIRVAGVSPQWVLRLGDESVCIEGTPSPGTGS
jgi:type IV secretion system protein VirB9